jgi:hypothetical protein
MLSLVMLIVVMLSVAIFLLFYHNVECRYDECRYAECHYAECRGAVSKHRFYSANNMSKSLSFKFTKKSASHDIKYFMHSTTQSSKLECLLIKNNSSLV